MVDSAEYPDREDVEGWFKREGWLKKWPLQLAAYSGDEELINILCSEQVCDPNLKMTDWYDSTPLVWDASAGHLGTVKLLIKLGADPLVPPNNAGYTPLGDAIREGRLATAQFLKDYEIEKLGSLRELHHNFLNEEEEVEFSEGYNEINCEEIYFGIQEFLNLADQRWQRLDNEEFENKNHADEIALEAGFFSQQAANYSQVFAAVCKD